MCAQQQPGAHRAEMLFVRTMCVSHKSYTGTQTCICAVLHCQMRRTVFGITAHFPQFWEQVVNRHHVFTLFGNALHHCIAMSHHVIEIVVMHLSVGCERSKKQANKKIVVVSAVLEVFFLCHCVNHQKENCQSVVLTWQVWHWKGDWIFQF